MLYLNYEKQLPYPLEAGRGITVDMNENDFIHRLYELQREYKDYLEEYDNKDSWTLNRLILFKNRHPIWDNRVAQDELTTIRNFLIDAKLNTERSSNH